MEKLVVVKTLEEMKKLQSYVDELPKEEFIAYDTETNGVDKESKIIGFSICADLNLAYYVVLAYWSKEEQKLIWLETLKETPKLIKSLVGRPLIMQNAPFDCARTVENFGIELIQDVHTDTMILGHILNENRSNGLKERGIELYGEDARAEQEAMKKSVTDNGGVLNKKQYELYKADADLLAYYGAKDAILTLRVFYNDLPILFEEGLDKFFYEDESMPLLRGPTYEMNTVGLRVDPEKLKNLRASLEAYCSESEAYINREIYEHVKEKYPGTGKTNHFNIGATQQLSWLLFDQLGEEFNLLTKSGKELCRALEIPLPYSKGGKIDFIERVRASKGFVWKQEGFNSKTKKKTRPCKVDDPYKYMACGKETLTKFSKKYRWVERLLEYKKNLKILNTYVQGIQDRMQYNVIRPSFLQHGTTSGRYSSKNPNFQNLPREDKRVKSCIVARKGKIFVGADFSQLEPRVFASQSQDKNLIECFKKGQDFYSVIGAPIFERQGVSLYKEGKDSFAALFPEERFLSKVIGLAAVYGANAYRLSASTKRSVEETQTILNTYFEKFYSVKSFMLSTYEEVKKNGIVYNHFGRPRRIPEALVINKLYKGVPHGELPYELRSMLNLAVNHKIQSTGASIMNRAALAFWKSKNELSKGYAKWSEVKILMQVHDELIVEGPEELKEHMIELLKFCMEKTVEIPDVELIAEPKAAYNLADLK